jgi:hypothetical protein
MENMMNFIKNLLLLSTLSFAIASSAFATTVSVTTSPLIGTPYTQTGKLAQKVGPNKGYYDAKWGPSATSVWTTLDANGDIGNQGLGNSDLTNWIKTTSGYTGNLVLVSNADSLSGSVGSFNFGNSLANFVAVHYGQAESLFYFANGINQFDLAFIQGNFGLSNYRAYGVDKPSSVPVPGAAWLLGSALIGFVSFSKRRKI